MRAETMLPLALERLDVERRLDLDVREDLRRGEEPLSRIMAAVSGLGPGGVLVLREQHGADDWSVWFYPDLIVLDVRGLEPPEPMVRVLKALDRLAPGQRLEVRHSRRPTLLYPQLEDRGFVHETDEQELGLVRIVLRQPTETVG